MTLSYSCKCTCLFSYSGNPLPCTHDGITLGFGEKRVDYEKCEEYTCGNDGSFGICGYVPVNSKMLCYITNVSHHLLFGFILFSELDC